MFRQLEGRDKHDLQHPRPLVLGELLDGRHVLDARVVHEDVHASVLAQHPPGESARLIHVREVGLDERPADSLGNVVSGFAHVVDDDPRPLLHEAFGYRLADAARPAGYQRGLIGKGGHIRWLSPAIR